MESHGVERSTISLMQCPAFLSLLALSYSWFLCFDSIDSIESDTNYHPSLGPHGKSTDMKLLRIVKDTPFHIEKRTQ